MTYEERRKLVFRAFDTAPSSQVPALIITALEQALSVRGVFLPGGAALLAQRIEDRIERERLGVAGETSALRSGALHNPKRSK